MDVSRAARNAGMTPPSISTGPTSPAAKAHRAECEDRAQIRIHSDQPLETFVSRGCFRYIS